MTKVYLSEQEEMALSRRAFAVTGLSATAWFAASGRSLAQTMSATPSLPAGPYYPDAFSSTPLGDLTLGALSGDSKAFTLAGRVLDMSGKVQAGVRVELWQCDGRAKYHHDAHSVRSERDSNFNGFGWQRTDEAGRFAFRTIKIVPCAGRAPHYHVGVAALERRHFFTQFFLPEHRLNANDLNYRNLSQSAREALTVKLEAVADGEAGFVTIVLA